jgi:glycosyltransferase involved in cell wall biosynthesis
MKKIIIHNIELAKAGLGISGGEISMLELIKEWSENENFENIIYTSENGKTIYDQILNKSPNYIIVGSYWLEKKLGIFVSYIWRTTRALIKWKDPEFDNKHIVISHSDFWPNVIYAYLFKKKNPQAKWLAFCHMLAPSVLHGYKYAHVPGKFSLPSFAQIHFCLSQKLFFLLSRSADAVFTVNQDSLSKLKKHNVNSFVLHPASNAGNYTIEIKSGKLDQKKFDLCFIGRLHEQKGIFELVDIVEKLVAQGAKEIVCAAIGRGDNALAKRFLNKIKERNLEKNLLIMGSKFEREKYQIINDSKILIIPSYYESSCFVYFEAISLGVPVFEYDLPYFAEHKFGAQKIKYLDNDEFAEKILALLKDPGEYRRLSKEALAYSQEFSWKKEADFISQFF